MVRRYLWLLTAAAVGAGAFAAVGAAANGNGTMCVLNTQLRPGNEVRPAGSSDPVDSTAKGHAQIKVRNDGTLEYKVFILNKAGERFSAGHIHAAPAGQNAGVWQDLFVPPAPATDARHIRQRGEIPARADSPATPQDESFAALCENPAGFYVNYHTVANPDRGLPGDPAGAVRGQLG